MKDPADDLANADDLTSSIMGTRERRAGDREAALRAALVQAALDCIVIIDASGAIIEFNAAAERTFGHRRADVLGRHMADLLIPTSLRSAHEAGMSKYLETGKHAVLGNRIEVPALHADGRELLVELAITPVHLEDQTYFTAYLRDITEQRADEEELKRSRQRYQDLFERSGDAIFVHTLEGEIVDVNKRAEELVGHSREALIGTALPRLHPTDDHAAAKAAIQAVHEHGEARVDVRFIHRSGIEIPTEVNARVFDADDRKLVHGVVRDVSDRARTEAELRMAKADAERASAAKTEFLANMSHEMRTPLNGVIGPLGLIDRKTLSSETANLIALAESSAESLLTLIDDILDISHIESGRVDLLDEPFAPEELLGQVREIFSNSAAEKRIGLDVGALPADLCLRGDAGRLRQILFNLVGNAVKFTEKGGVSVTAALDETDAGPVLALHVVDTGIGIAENEMENLFSRFQQGESSARSKNDGVGLGLAITRELVELMGGQISAASKPGSGSRFSVRLPARICRAATDTGSEPSRERRLHGRVLLAEDSETNAAVAASMLGRLGIEPDIVSDGAAAVQAADAGDYDLIIMDVGMPLMDGLEASKLIRESGHGMPIVALTAHALPENKEQTRAAGMNGFLTKPIRLKDLSRELEKWLPRADSIQYSVVRPGHIDEQWGGDRDGYAFVLNIFLGELTTRLERLESLLIAGDVKGIGHEAHALKGGAINVGGEALSDVAARLEQAAKSGPKDGELDQHIADLSQAANIFRAAIAEQFPKP